MTQITSTGTSTRTTTRASCTCEHIERAVFVVHLLMSCHTHLMTQDVLESSLHPIFVHELPFYFDLTFTVFFHSSVLMHPEPHTDLDNLNTVQHNLPNSAKGSNDAYDVTVSLTPKDRNCEICKRTKITMASCRRRIGGVVLRAEKFGGLITADHKVLSEGCESRNNHRYAIVVQDLATQWVQSYPCKTKTSQETPRSFPGIIARRHHTDRKLMGLLKEQHAE